MAVVGGWDVAVAVAVAVVPLTPGSALGSPPVPPETGAVPVAAAGKAGAGFLHCVPGLNTSSDPE